jgi:ribosomal protein S18 acetylase RimI-like enzyme
MKYTLRPLEAKDKEFLRNLNERCYKDVVICQFGEWDTDLQQEFFEKKWEPDKFQAICTQDGDVGAISVWEEENVLHLSEILVDPTFQNRGLGTEVLKTVLETATSKHIKVRLQVLHENKARHLYRRLGFFEYGKTDTHILMEYPVSRDL